jgi:hypothetical protein
MTSYIINPRTNRKIKVNGNVWETLSNEEKIEGEKRMNRKNDIVCDTLSHEEKIEGETIQKDDIVWEMIVCTKCDNSVNNTTKCCKQILCSDCMSGNVCPYCTSHKPKKQKRVNSTRVKYKIWRIHQDGQVLVSYLN